MSAIEDQVNDVQVFTNRALHLPGTRLQLYLHITAALAGICSRSRDSLLGSGRLGQLSVKGTTWTAASGTALRNLSSVDPRHSSSHRVRAD